MLHLCFVYVLFVFCLCFACVFYVCQNPKILFSQNKILDFCLTQVLRKQNVCQTYVKHVGDISFTLAAGLYQVWISNWQLLDTGGTANSCFTYVANFTHMFCFMCHLCFNYIPFMFRLRSTYVSFMFHICFYLRLDIVYVYVMPRPPSIETIPGAPLDQAKQSLAPATRNEIWMSKSGPNVVWFKHFDFEMCFAPQRRALFRRRNFQKWSGPGVLCTFWLRNVLRATTACTFSTSQLPKVDRELCFAHFDFEMCFAPQRRALFRHLNFQKWSENGVFCTFWLRNVLRATTACTFSTSQLPKVVREWCALHILTSKCASRHNGVHFFDISTSKSGPRMVCFAHFDLEMCFAPQRRALFHRSSGQMAPSPPL